MMSPSQTQDTQEPRFVRLKRRGGRRLGKVAAGLVVVGTAIAAFAGTCVVQDTRMTNIDGNDTFGGEIVNETGVNLLGTEVAVGFLDSAGNVVETQQVEPALRSFQDGAANFFSAAADADASDTSSALARLATDSSMVIGTTAEGDIELTDIAAERDEDGEVLRVTGTITNRDNDTLDEPAVAVVVRDDDGNVVVVAKDADIEDLGEDESAVFAIDIDVPDSDSTVSYVDVWADGLEGSVPVTPASNTGTDVDVIEAATSTPTATSTPEATATP